MTSKASRVFHKRGVQFGGVFLLLLLAIAVTGVTKAHAVTYDLTGNGLGLSEGNYEPSITVSPELTLSALTTGSATGYPNGIPGLVFLHQTEGTGVRWGDIGNSSKRISGWGIGSYESLVLDFHAGVDAQSVTMWFDEIQMYAGGDTVPVDLWVTPFLGSAFQISDVLSYLHYTDSDTAYVVFSELPDLSGVGSIERVIARARHKYHFYVSQISFQAYDDNDGDGYPADNDCDDSNADVNPEATEVCNDIDDDCDDNIDEGCTTYYRDTDEDGYGDPGDYIPDTSPPIGYVATGGDCDDTNGTIHPGATEACNGVDDDCDGTADEDCTLWYRDADGDTYGDPGDTLVDTSQPPGYVPNGGDCDDTNSEIKPGVQEACNGLDDNCDGNIDEGCVSYYRDADEDGYGDPDDFVVTTSPPAGYVTNNGDCDDTNVAINPEAIEVCNDVDDNCEGGIDEGCRFYYWDDDGDSYGNPAIFVEDTAPPEGFVANSDDCDDTNVNIYPGAAEICNGVDDNCDEDVDEGTCTPYCRDADGDTYGDPADLIPADSPPPGYVIDCNDCDDSDQNVNPGASEQCNGVDDNCDGQVDEGLPCDVQIEILDTYVTRGGGATRRHFWIGDRIYYNIDYRVTGGAPNAKYTVIGSAYSIYDYCMTRRKRTARGTDNDVEAGGPYTITFRRRIPACVEPPDYVTARGEWPKVRWQVKLKTQDGTILLDKDRKRTRHTYAVHWD
jgi:hypothetical protein